MVAKRSQRLATLGKYHELGLEVEQDEAVHGIINGFNKGAKIQALIGAGGTGKTFTIDGLINKHLNSEYPLILSATTNKAASVMFTGTTTTHKAIYELEWSDMAKDMMKYIFKLKEEEHYVMDRWTENFLGDKLYTFKKHAKLGYEKALKVCGIDPYKKPILLIGERVKDPQLSRLLIDEASMLTYDYLKDAMKAYPLGIILVGDNMQLPPVTDNPNERGCWRYAENTFELKENHRNKTPANKFINHIRNGNSPFEWDYSADGVHMFYLPDDRNVVATMDAAVPFITYRNAVANQVNSVRRGANFNAKMHPIYVLSKPHKGQTGQYYPSQQKYQLDSDEDTTFEDELYDCHFNQYPYKGHEVQLAYAITAHKAQGSEWDNVMVDIHDWRVARKMMGVELAQKWLYTAVSRARENIALVDIRWI